MVSFVGVLRPLRLRFEAEAVISLSACLDAPIRPPRSRDDLGVKNRVKDLGVIVGAFRGLLPCCLLRLGSAGDEPRVSPLDEVVQLDTGFSCDPHGVKSSIPAALELHIYSVAREPLSGVESDEEQQSQSQMMSRRYACWYLKWQSRSYTSRLLHVGFKLSRKEVFTGHARVLYPFGAMKIFSTQGTAMQCDDLAQLRSGCGTSN